MNFVVKLAMDVSNLSSDVTLSRIAKMDLTNRIAVSVG